MKYKNYGFLTTVKDAELLVGRAPIDVEVRKNSVVLVYDNDTRVHVRAAKRIKNA